MTENRNNGRSIPEMSVDTRVLITRLMQVDVGGFIAHQDLSSAIGRDVQEGARGNLTTARHRLEVDEGIQFGAVVGKGLRRLDGIGVMGGSDAAIRHCNRALTKEAQRLSKIDHDELPKEKLIELNVKAAQVQVLAYQMKPKVLKKLEAKLAASGALPMAKLLDAVRETL